jgi:hypothetical protein
MPRLVSKLSGGSGQVSHSVAPEIASFLDWRGRVPVEAGQVTESTDTASLPQTLRAWLERTRNSQLRVAFVLEHEWWAYEFLLHGPSQRDNPERSFFVIASSDRLDPEWGADHNYHQSRNEWTLAASASEVTRDRLSSTRSKA